ncbi:MAG: hypothetical protein QG622_892 [Actinomycetota bacterium]|nr:hypothetical protein [Actinomycetota bacterium]
MSDAVNAPGENPEPGGSAPEPGSFAAAFAEQFSLEEAIGGPRGMIEAVVPMTLFSFAFGLGASMRTAVIAALASSVVFAVARLVSRQPLTHALSGVLGIALGAYLAMRTGRAENFVLPSLVKNSAQGAAFALSALVRWPILGLILGMVRGEGVTWRRDPSRLRAYSRATWVWAGMFGVRLAVQVPLWMAGAAAALGFANVVLGLPLFGLVMWLTWAIVRDPEPLAVRRDASPG